LLRPDRESSDRIRHAPDPLASARPAGHTAGMSEREDYAEPESKGRRASPLLTVALIAAVLVLCCMLAWIGFLVLVSLNLQH